jgi:hypothetical protein
MARSTTRPLSGRAGKALAKGTRSHFLRIPVSVSPRFFVALCAVGVSTALPCVPATGPEALLFCDVPMLFPVVPWLSAFEVLGPDDPPVPLIVLPFESVEPAAPPAPVDPAELPAAVWADAGDHAARQSANATGAILIMSFLHRMLEPITPHPACLLVRQLFIAEPVPDRRSKFKAPEGRLAALFTFAPNSDFERSFASAL